MQDLLYRQIQKYLLYCLCLLERECHLNKTWLPDHRKLYSIDIPVCKSKNKCFQKIIPIQKEQIRYRNKNKKYGWGPILSFWKYSVRVYWSAPDTKDWMSFSNKIRKGSWVIRFGECEYENSPICELHSSLIWETLDVLECM